jgi:two-component system, chemotaxis family, chemotaxis protein CheY
MQQTRILLVDDDRLMLTLLIGVLRHEGFHHVEMASSGKDALERFLHHPPEIVFVDIEMPVLDGIQTLKAIKAFGTVAQVVMVTASPTAQYVKAAKEGGAAGFLVKPISPAKVVDAVRDCLERIHQEEGSIELFPLD